MRGRCYREAIFNEIEIASRVNCEHLAGVEEFFLTESEVCEFTQRSDHSTILISECQHAANWFGCPQVYLVQRLMEGGMLYDDMMLRPGQRYAEEEARCIIKQVLQGLAYLHGRWGDWTGKSGCFQIGLHSVKLIVHLGFHLLFMILHYMLFPENLTCACQNLHLFMLLMSAGCQECGSPRSEAWEPDALKARRSVQHKNCWFWLVKANRMFDYYSLWHSPVHCPRGEIAAWPTLM